MSRSLFRFHRVSGATAAGLLLLSLIASPSLATWSIVASDSLTQEVAIASATCLTGFDLRAVSPALVVGEGGGALQSAVDTTGQRRQIVRDGLLNGLTSQQIIDQLAALSGSDLHQNGVTGTDGGGATFSGVSTFPFSLGVTGSVGSIFYAIQGNLLTGQPVITMAEQALRDTVGDLAEKAMAAMQAARAMGGDGRCSCPGSVTGCGSPPPSFTKSADIGYMLVARFGDADSASCGATGCAEGDYFLDHNIAFQSSADPDPVAQLQDLFDAWRLTLDGRPDAVRSTVDYSPDGTVTRMTVGLRQWNGTPFTTGGATVTVVHAAQSAGVHDIGPVVDVGDGTYRVELTPDGGDGTDFFRITVDDGLGEVIIPPRTTALDSAIFRDGFESGDTSSWSSTN